MSNHTVKYFNKERMKGLQFVHQDQFAVLRNIFKLNVTDKRNKLTIVNAKNVKAINSGKKNSISDSAEKSIFSQTTAFYTVDISASLAMMSIILFL